MRTIKTIMMPLLIALAMGTFTACSDSGSNSEPEIENTPANTRILNATEDANVSLGTQILSISTEQAQVKLTRDVEAEIVNVYVISGSVEVAEAVSQ